MAYGSRSPERRTAVLQAVSNKLGEVMESNVHEIVGMDDPRNYKQEFIDFLNRRFADYSNFDFPDDERASFPALRFLGLQIRDEMGDDDKSV